MRIARQAEFAAAEVTEILFGIERNVHRGEMNVMPGSLDRMRGAKSGGAAHADQRIDDRDAQFRCPRTITYATVLITMILPRCASARSTRVR